MTEHRSAQQDQEMREESHERSQRKILKQKEGLREGTLLLLGFYTAKIVIAMISDSNGEGEEIFDLRRECEPKGINWGVCHDHTGALWQSPVLRACILCTAQMTDYYIQPEGSNSQFHVQEPGSLLLSLIKSKSQVNLWKNYIMNRSFGKVRPTLHAAVNIKRG